MTVVNIYEQHLDKSLANFTPLSPLSYIERTAVVYPNYPSVVYGDRKYSWAQTYARCRRLASALTARGIGQGDTVSIIAANIPELYEAHFGVPMADAVLNAINTRLDAPTIAFILKHAEAKVLLMDPEFSSVVKQALAQVDHDVLLVDIEDPSYDGGERLGNLTYEALLAEGDPEFDWSLPADEWDAITLNYTSGTTGNPKGVVYHHRGAALNATSNILTWGMPQHSVYLWTLPMFHCNGWCFPWTMAANAGTSVCLRAVRDEPIYRAFREEGVTHFCGAPIVLNMLVNAPDHLKDFNQQIKVMTAGAPPPAKVIEAMEGMGVEVTHVYGLTETYGPSVVCAWKDEWNEKGAEDRAALKVRQGVKYVALSGLMVADPETLEPVPSDGETMGEIFMQGNIVMKGYLKNPDASDKAFKRGWFASGDLGVMHPDGYIALKDRSKDIIISGGENISSIEIEDILYKHPAVMEAAVVARPDEKWGETPCAFVELKPDVETNEAEILTFCRDHMARFKAPRTVVFGALPKTSTGKIQKFILRDQARKLG